MNDNRILVALKSSNATLAVLTLALAAQIPHAADVFRLIVHGNGWLSTVHSYGYAVALELAVLLFVVQGRHLESYGFAVVSVCINLSYYYLHSVALFSPAALPAWLISVALPIAIARYSHAVVEPVQHTVVEPVPTVAPVHVGAEDVVQPVQSDKRQQAHNMHSEGFTIAQIAKELSVHRNTVGGWLRANGAKAVQS